MSDLAIYISEVDRLFRSGAASEHSYRPALQNCLTKILKNVEVTNEPRRQLFGAPDYILTRGGITVGWIEAKDIDKDLTKVEKGSKDDDQWHRYTSAQPNIVLTDYLEFRFFRDSQRTESIRIGEVRNGKVVALNDNFARFETLFRDFGAFQGQTIRSAKKLAEMMAHKASLMRDVFFKVVSSDEASTLKDQFSAFKEILVHDMDAAQFADVYAQTVAYGLFTARLHDDSPENFTRGEALTLIPKTNPFLQKLFQYVAGADLDDRIAWIVDSLCEVYLATHPEVIKEHFNRKPGQSDPILHFYETFLAEYDPKLREVRGVYYTPEPVVQFIVRAVDDVLKDHFGLKDGLADTSKVEITVDGHAKGKVIKVKEKIHKVQILDVATGTGTFLAEVVKKIHHNVTGGGNGQQGLWSDYVSQHLLPRMHGFELLIASYAMCHLKLDMLLRDTGYDSSKSSKRLSVYLTNSLEEHHKDSHLPFANWLSTEANEASRIKRDMPIMIAIGNPPYSGESANKGAWITKLLEDYKKEPGGKVKLKEKNPKWLNDDYVKFIRLGQHYVEKNSEGILAYITNHSYLDNPTFRGMRWKLLQSFDDIYIIDLHGSTKKTSVSPDGQPDKNVFDIMQGVSILIAVKTNLEQKELANLYHANLWGTRQKKYDILSNSHLSNLPFKPLIPNAPEFFFFPRDTARTNELQSMVPVNKMFLTNSVGIVTARDNLTIHHNQIELDNIIHKFSEMTVEDARQQFDLGQDARDWRVEWAQADLKKTNLHASFKQKILYRPFDVRWTYYTGNSRGFMCMPRKEVMQQMIKKAQIGLMVCRQIISNDWAHVYCSKWISDDSLISNKSRERGYLMPLYTFEKIGDLEEKRSNFDPKIYQSFKKKLNSITPESLFDYIYAVLHSPAYRKRYAEFLKSDFPRIPYPQDEKTFNALAKLGGEIRALHLMEAKTLDDFVTGFPVGGDHEVVKPRWEDTDKKAGLGRVHINPQQYFDRVPKTAWEFFIGGYQPAQKWLKDRQGRKLTMDDIRHWQRVIVALSETDRLMREIDNVDFLPKDGV